MAASDPHQKTWDSFISYSHAADGKLAPALQSGLQRFMRPWYRRRALRIFRDDSGLTVNPGLWTSIAGALDRSRYFILLASPEAARSAWVDREIRHWLTTASVDTLLPVVTAGEWVWNAANGDFDWERSTAVPPALRGVLHEEPRHLDLRWAQHAAALDLRNPRFLDAIAELAAPMYGKAKDELVGEDIRLHRRARRLTWAAVSSLLLLTIAAVAAAVYAERRRVDAVAERLAVQSRQLAGQPDLAFLLAAEAHRLRPVPETMGAVFAALQGVPELRRMVRHHTFPVSSIAVLPKRELILSGDVEGHVVATSRITNAVLARYDHPLNATVTCLLPDEEKEVVWLATTSGLLSLGLPDLTPAGAELTVPQAPINCARHPKRPLIALTGMDGALFVWDLVRQRVTAMRDAEQAQAHGLAYSNDGRFFAYGASQGAIRLLSGDDGRLLKSIPAGPRGDTLSLAFRADGRELVTGHSDGWIHTWRIDGGTTEPSRSRRAHTGAVWKIGYTRGHPAGDYIGSVGPDGAIAWVEAASFLPYAPTRVHRGRVNALDFGDDGTYVTGGDDGVIAYFDPQRPPVLGDHRRDIGRPISFLLPGPGPGEIVVIAGADGQVQTYELSTLTPKGPSRPAGTGVVTAAHSPDRNQLALGTTDGRLVIQSIAGSGQEWPQAHRGSIVSLAWSPDGHSLFSLGDDRQLRQWPVTGGRISQPRVLDELASRAIAIHPAGDWIAYGHLEDGVRVIAPRTGRRVARLQRGRATATTALAFRPERSLLLVGDAYGQLGAWKTQGWTLQHEPTPGHQGEITTIAAADDRIFTAGRDGTLRLWSATTGEPLGVPITGHNGPVLGLAYDAASRQVISGGPDGILAARPMDVERWIDQGCAMFTRTLTPGERVRFQISPPDGEPCRAIPSTQADEPGSRPNPSASGRGQDQFGRRSRP